MAGVSRRAPGPDQKGRKPGPSAVAYRPSSVQLYPYLHRIGLAGDLHNRAGTNIRQVIMRAGRMIDAVPTTPGRAALKAHQLGDHTGVVQQLAAAAVDDGEKVAVQIRLGALRRLVGYAMLVEALARPLARVSIADHFR